MFSKTCEYAIKIMIYLWHRDYTSTSWAGIKEIAGAIQSPPSFTAKVTQQLAKGGLLKSQRGPKGGFAKVKGSTVTLADIVTVIDGPHIMEKCVLGFEDCSMDYPCPLHNKFEVIREELNAMLISTDLEQISELMKSDEVFLK